MSDKDKILDFSDELIPLNRDISEIDTKINVAKKSISETSTLVQSIMDDLQQLPCGLGISNNVPFMDSSHSSIEKLDITINDLKCIKLSGEASLSILDVFVAIIAGIIASTIDIVFVGTPEVVKIYKGGENLDGSILTAAIRKAGKGNNTFTAMLEWCCEKCKVPYDISVQKGVVNPNNHRLRSFSHDPLLGVFFSVAILFLEPQHLLMEMESSLWL